LLYVLWVTGHCGDSLLRSGLVKDDDQQYGKTESRPPAKGVGRDPQDVPPHTVHTVSHNTYRQTACQACEPPQPAEEPGPARRSFLPRVAALHGAI